MGCWWQEGEGGLAAGSPFGRDERCPGCVLSFKRGSGLSPSQGCPALPPCKAMKRGGCGKLLRVPTAGDESRACGSWCLRILVRE